MYADIWFSIEATAMVSRHQIDGAGMARSILTVTSPDGLQRYHLMGPATSSPEGTAAVWRKIATLAEEAAVAAERGVTAQEGAK